MGITDKKNTYICPHCLKRFKYSDIWFKCTSYQENSAIRHDNVLRVLNSRGDNLGDEKRSERREKAKLIKESDNMYAKLARLNPFPNNILFDDPISDRIEDDPKKKAIKKCCAEAIFKASRETCGRSYDPEKIPATAQCPYCESRSAATVHVCPNPNCHEIIKINPDEEQIVVALAGAKSNGKTVFLASLLFDISNRLSQIATSWVPQFNDVAKDLINKYYEFLKDGRPLDSTSNQQSEAAIVYFNKGGKRYSFIFYDVAGEIFASESGEEGGNRVKDTRQFCFPDFVIFLTEPRSHRGIHNLVNKSPLVDDEYKTIFKNGGSLTGLDDEKSVIIATAASTVFTTRELILESIAGNPDTAEDYERLIREKLPIPMAVCLSKSDTFSRAFSEDNKPAFLKDSYLAGESNGNMNYTTFRQNFTERSNSLRAYFENEWNEANFPAQVDACFGESVFIALSATGEPKKIESQYDCEPFNVIDPFVWILSHIDERIFDRPGTNGGLGQIRF